MTTLTPTPPVYPSSIGAPAKPTLPRPSRRALPPDDIDLGGGQPTGPRDTGAPYVPPAKRRSVWPFLTDRGLVMALFGLIIAGRPLMAIGAVLFVVALIGWFREARAEFQNLAE